MACAVSARPWGGEKPPSPPKPPPPPPAPPAPSIRNINDNSNSNRNRILDLILNRLINQNVNVVVPPPPPPPTKPPPTTEPPCETPPPPPCDDDGGKGPGSSWGRKGAAGVRMAPGPPVPVQDTPEVKAAKADFFRAYNEAAARAAPKKLLGRRD